MTNTHSLDAALAPIRPWIAQAERITVLTGAGISTESGIPDFRGPQGTWTKDPEAEKLSTLQYYLSDPDIRKRAWRARLASPAWSAQPNAGHLALLELERRGKLHTLITQNIDGLHLTAGHAPQRVVEIHGTIREVVCMACGERGPMAKALARVNAGEDDPPCLSCGGILKSATISFGQNLVATDLARAEQAARECDLLLAIGTTLSVYPVAGLVPIAKQAGARLMIVNGGPTEMDDIADALLRGPIGELLPALLAAPLDAEKLA
ncbi:MAG: Sir2 family NAD-dependent protein deacetylase [Gammaproteobacteria bacterium]